MNIRQLTLVAATALAFPIASHAQETSSGLTRAQVRADLVQIEKAGYRPGQNDRYYPTDIQAAEAKLAATNGTSVNTDSGVGGVASGTSDSSARVAFTDNSRSLFAHH
ncbi:DUF4148 domain-containing protein [Paraburkholderia megapolitana]|uniref:DUF4148 domain-containing protein n=1 Tax=Paraburkholderia megapolitana TaxID=420953 RepID=UPI0038B6D017